MVELGEWNISVSVPSQIPDELAAAVSGAVSAEIRRWAAEANAAGACSGCSSISLPFDQRASSLNNVHSQL